MLDISGLDALEVSTRDVCVFKVELVRCVVVVMLVVVMLDKRGDG